MNYTKTIREYCLSNPDTVFDVSIMMKSHFTMIPYKTLLKILNRLEEEKIVKKISKGVYYISDYVLSVDEAIFDEYVDNARGMFVGYKMYNQYGISQYKDSKIEIYTSKLSKEHKTIGNYVLKGVDLPFTNDICNMIKSLELIQNGYKIKDRDDKSYLENMDLPLATYQDYIFEIVNDAIKYNYSTIVTLDRKLSKYGIPNKCREIYNKKYPVE